MLPIAVGMLGAFQGRDPGLKILQPDTQGEDLKRVLYEVGEKLCELLSSVIDVKVLAVSKLLRRLLELVYLGRIYWSWNSPFAHDPIVYPVNGTS